MEEGRTRHADRFQIQRRQTGPSLGQRGIMCAPVAALLSWSMHVLNRKSDHLQRVNRHRRKLVLHQQRLPHRTSPNPIQSLGLVPKLR